MNDSIRILNLVYILPTPPYSGYELRHVNLMRNLSDRVQQTMLCRIKEPLTPTQQIYCEQAPFEIRTVLLPRPAPLKKAMKAVRFIFGKFPIAAAGWYFNEMAQALKETLADETFDFVVLEGIWMSVYWPVLKKSTSRIVLNLYDLESVLLERQAATLPMGLTRMLYKDAARRMARLERTLVREADLIWTVSEIERQQLLDQNPDLPVYLAPGGVDCDSAQPLPFGQGEEILFVGNYGYYPNVDGVLYFVNHVFPIVLRRNPNAVCRIIGRQPGPQIKALHNPPSVLVSGEVDDVKPFYESCRLSVVPLRSGGGTRLKILESMALSRPVVSTTIGAEGIEIEHGRNILIADSPLEIAEAVCRLLDNPTLAKALAKEGRQLVEDKYDWKSIANSMYERYANMLR